MFDVKGCVSVYRCCSCIRLHMSNTKSFDLVLEIAKKETKEEKTEPHTIAAERIIVTVIIETLEAAE